ncbi:hypothetical protein KFL_002030070 [Klebsormidium nitens]|uniref:Uncharacterized protein n=1 Tax=Klebsormidium nitens TaxID=105231 RepID=A0A1Y1I1E1_KLENI|nr:hypothetical protein KFL_002030070 [Klebsormidium nitens]|eukprot:GAQ84724.1 hypothetical protein KFL_002030070 [Klebsormidium nitens]
MEGPKEVEVKWKECSRSSREVLEMIAEYEQATFDLAKPEESDWVQMILKDATCGDLETSVCAFGRFVNIFSKLVHEQGKAKAAETASYILQRGFAKELHAGLKDARSSGAWFLLPKSDRTGVKFLLSRVEAYASVLGLLTVDERTASFFLKEMEALLVLLEGLFYQAAHPSLAKLTQSIGVDQDPATDARRAIIRAISALIEWSKRAQRFMIKRRSLYLDMIREIAKMHQSGNPSETDYLTVEINLPAELCPDSETLTEEQGIELCEMLAEHNPTIKSRVERIAAAAKSPICKNTPLSKRKCSSPACDKIEPESERFKTVKKLLGKLVTKECAQGGTGGLQRKGKAPGVKARH